MIEWLMTGNVGRAPDKTKELARATICCNVPINNTYNTEPVWVDIETRDIGMATQLLKLGKGDGVIVRGQVRVNFYEHRGKEQKGWVMDLNQLHVTHRKQ